MSPGFVLNYGDDVVGKIVRSECSALAFSVSKYVFIMLKTMMNNLSSSGHRKPSRLILSMSSHSCVSFSEGIKSGGCVERGLRDNNGSSGNCRVTCASSGKVAGTG